MKGLLRRGEATEMVKAMQRGELKPGDAKKLIQAGREKRAKERQLALTEEQVGVPQQPPVDSVVQEEF